MDPRRVSACENAFGAFACALATDATDPRVTSAATEYKRNRGRECFGTCIGRRIGRGNFALALGEMICGNTDR